MARELDKCERLLAGAVAYGWVQGVRRPGEMAECVEVDGDPFPVKPAAELDYRPGVCPCLRCDRVDFWLAEYNRWRNDLLASYNPPAPQE